MRTIVWAVGFVIQIGTGLAQSIDPPITPNFSGDPRAHMHADVAALNRRLPCEWGCVQAKPGDYYSAINPDLSHVGPDLSRVGADMTSVKAR